MDEIIIAIDGPAASGKTTVGRLLAERLGFLFLDTGSMYRAVTLGVIDNQINPADQEAVERYATEASIDVLADRSNDGRAYTVLLNGQDVTWQLRSAAVDRLVSQISAYRRVRHELVQRQRVIAQKGNVVLVGRDIGTVVVPNAPIKIYVTASLEERAKRRWQEKRERDQASDYQAILGDMQRRDRLDSSRAVSPLRPADDAIVVDSTNQPPEMIVEYVIDLLSDVLQSSPDPACK